MTKSSVIMYQNVVLVTVLGPYYRTDKAQLPDYQGHTSNCFSNQNALLDVSCLGYGPSPPRVYFSK